LRRISGRCNARLTSAFCERQSLFFNDAIDLGLNRTAHVSSGGGNAVERAVIAGSSSDGEHPNDSTQVVIRHIGGRHTLLGNSPFERRAEWICVSQKRISNG
jgi:hypothetical protein